MVLRVADRLVAGGIVTILSQSGPLGIACALSPSSQHPLND
jgi:hypothetical protein